MDREGRNDRFTALEERYEGYNVYDPQGERIGKVDDLFVDETDEPEYLGVKMGFLGTRSTLIPWEAVSRTDDEDRRIEVSVDKQAAKDGPAFDDDREITPEYEEEVYSYYGLTRRDVGDETTTGHTERGGYGDYYSDEEETGEHGDAGGGAGSTGSTSAGTVGAGMSMGDTESGEFREHDRGDEGISQSRGSDLEDEDELRVQRSEEELRAGTREREAGSVKVRKRVRTERERLEVPTRHEEVHVDRVPVEEGTAAEGEIGEDEVNVPVTEEEVVVDKKPVVKEELRIRKDAVEDTETVEDEVRKEEVEVDDDTERRNR